MQIRNRELKIILFFLSFCISFIMFFSHPQGDDEMVSIFIAQELYQHVINLKFFDFSSVLLQNYHPPGRELVLMLSHFVFEDNLVNARIISVTLYAFIIIKLFELSYKISNDKFISFFISTLIVFTGMFQIQAMVSIHGVTTLMGILMIIKFLDIQERKNNLLKSDIYMIIIFNFIAFLFSNSFLLISLPSFIILNYLLIINDYKLKKIIYLNTIILIFYLLYYLVFLFVPYYLHENGFTNEPIGQYYKYLYRIENTNLKFTSLIENFKIVNFYTFPILFYILSLLGTLFLFLKFRFIFILLFLYFITFQFFIKISTGQHYLSYIIWTFPFGIYYIIERIIKIKIIKKNFIILSPAVLLIIFSWTFNYHIKFYNEKNFPKFTAIENLIDFKWTHNKRFPLVDIENELMQIKKNNTLNLAGSEWNIYFKKKDYFYNKDVISKDYNCKELNDFYRDIEAILFKENINYSCIKNFENSKIINFKNSSFILVKKK